MLQTMRNAWKIDDLRHKILFTLVIILHYRLGNAVPVPYVNIDALNGYFAQMQNTVLGLLNVMSGGAFSSLVRRLFTFCTMVVISGWVESSARMKFWREGNCGVAVTSTTMTSPVRTPQRTST